MNRDIKFRAWDADEKIMNGGYDIDDSFFDYKSNRGGSGGNIQLMQFTGLHDKNGKEIYEGDIIATIHNGEPLAKHEIIFHKGAFRPRALWGRASSVPSQVTYSFWNDYEIIGNIHENKNLLP